MITKPEDVKPTMIDISDFENNENIGMKRPMFDAHQVGQIIQAVTKCYCVAVDNVHTSGLDEAECLEVNRDCDEWAILAENLQK